MIRVMLLVRLLTVSLAVALPLPVWSALARQEADLARIASPTPLATPLPADATSYVDPQGRFMVPIPTGWRAASVGDAGVLTSPEGGIVISVLMVPGDDVPAAVTEAWRVVEPGFDLKPGEILEVPPTAGLRPFTVVEYPEAPANEVVQAIGQRAEGQVFVALIRADLDEAARRASQVQTAALGIVIEGLAEQSLRGVLPHALTAAELGEIDAFVQTTMARFAIPGVSYAVVQDGQIIHAAGFGVRELGGSDPVTPETLMMVGSVTKPMTTTYMATVVDDGKMRWDEPAIEILPSFAVADPVVTRQLTVRDLVCACTGVPRRDLELIFETEGVTAADIIASLQEFTFFTPVGEAFQYSNQMVAAGGYIAAIAAGGDLGTVLDDYVGGMEERLFAPIGMDATTFSEEDALASGDYALPHAKALDGSVASFPLDLELAAKLVAPAGGAWSNVEDLGRFVITQLDRGSAPSGTRIVSVENLEETWTPRVAIGPGFAYGLGWVVADYQDQPMLVHDGGTLGYNAEIAFLPEAGIGVAILANQSNALSIAEAIRTRVFETAFNLPSEGGAALDFVLEQQESAVTELAAVLGPVEEELVAPFLGAWEHPALGAVTLSFVDNRLILDAGEFSSELAAIDDPEIGETGYITSTSPLAGLSISLRTEDDDLALVVHDPASTDLYVFALIVPR